MEEPILGGGDKRSNRLQTLRTGVTWALIFCIIVFLGYFLLWISTLLFPESVGG